MSQSEEDVKEMEDWIMLKTRIYKIKQFADSRIAKYGHKIGRYLFWFSDGEVFWFRILGKYGLMIKRQGKGTCLFSERNGIGVLKMFGLVIRILK